MIKRLLYNHFSKIYKNDILYTSGAYKKGIDLCLGRQNGKTRLAMKWLLKKQYILLVEEYQFKLAKKYKLNFKSMGFWNDIWSDV